MKKFIIALAALAAISTSAFADGGFSGSDHPDGLNRGFAFDNDVTSLPLIKKSKLHTTYVQSGGFADQGDVGYLTKNTISGANTFSQQ